MTALRSLRKANSKDRNGPFLRVWAYTRASIKLITITLSVGYGVLNPVTLTTNNCARLAELPPTGLYIVWTDNGDEPQDLNWLDTIPPERRLSVGDRLVEGGMSMKRWSEV